uniref:Uncharacterized protein n=1 Tax=Oryza punctata TaxID=4537 RepID=A0A0E0JGH1_ORYPU
MLIPYAYRTSRCSGGPASRRHHRHSRSANGTPSSVVIVGAEPTNAPGSLLLGLRLGGSPRQLVSSLQRTGSSNTASAGVTPERGDKNQILRHYDEVDHDDVTSSVCSVDAGPMAAMAAASSCSCRRSRRLWSEAVRSPLHPLHRRAPSRI